MGERVKQAVAETEEKVRARDKVRERERHMRKSMLCPPGTECHDVFFTLWYNGGLEPFTAGVTLSNRGRDGGRAVGEKCKKREILRKGREGAIKEGDFDGASNGGK